MSGLTPERWEQVSAILDEALEVSPEEVAPLLDARCGDDADLRREVEQMLEACAKAEHLMDRPPALSVRGMISGAESRGQIEVGDIVGAYRILDLLGRGGMGAVYLAERADGEFERQVALKVVKRGMDSEEILERFRSERQILAGLEHPNIAGLLDGGITADGRPFFAMELAVGEPIDQYCDRLRLPLEQRIELFVTVCEAVQHAHRNLIVHRDLKPGNIIVTEQGEVKLLDFGIAKVLDPSQGADRTRALGVRLTPEYAAPEQVVMGPTTTATDVYALGVILYELLSGQRPYVFTSGSMQEIEDLVCNTDPRRPSTRITFRDPEAKEETGGLPQASWLRSTNPGALRQHLAGDLDSIILKAMEKEPARRYGSAAELRQDLLNFLHGLPVEAHAQTGLYKLGKFIQRNRLVVALGSAASLALVVGAGLATAFGVEAQKQRRIAEDQAERAQKTQDFMVSVLEKFDPNETDGRALSSKNLVTRALAELDTLSGQPLLKAGSLNVLGQVAFNLGERHLADSVFRMSQYILTTDTTDTSLLATALSWRGRLLNEREEPEALDYLRQAIALRESEPDHDDRLLAADYMELAFALTVSASADGRTEDQKAAELAESALYLQQAASLPLNDRLRARRLEYLGDLAFTDRDAAGALERYRESRDLRTAVLPPNHPELGRAWLGLGHAYRARNDPDSSLIAFRRSADIFENAYGERHPLLGSAVYQTGATLRDEGRQTEAETLFRRAIEVSDPAERTEVRTLCVAYEALGRLLFDQGRWQAAEAPLREAIRLLPQFSRLRPITNRPRILLARILSERGDIDEASELLGAVLADTEPGDTRRREALEQLVSLESRRGRSEEVDRYRALLNREPVAATN
ncbi:MAG: protein kinase [Gemmatimonadota bacterium]